LRIGCDAVIARNDAIPPRLRAVARRWRGTLTHGSARVFLRILKKFFIDPE